jgi:nitroreductase
MTKDVIKAILERRSVRKFKDQEVPKATVEKIIDAARWAPSAGNIQPWQFYVVYNDNKKRMLISAALNQRFVGEAPVLIVVCVQPELSGAHYRERGRKLYCLQDSAAAVQNILLAATAYGLGSCWVGAFKKTEVIEALDLPMGTLPVAMIPLGYSDEEAVSPGRRPVEETVRVIE